MELEEIIERLQEQNSYFRKEKIELEYQLKKKNYSIIYKYSMIIFFLLFITISTFHLVKMDFYLKTPTIKEEFLIPPIPKLPPNLQ